MLVDLGYLTYYTSYMIATGAIQGTEGETFEAGRLGPRTITRAAGLRVPDGAVHGLRQDQRGGRVQVA